MSRYQKGKTNLDFTEARDSEWQWHQLSHMQICTSLQTNNHASTTTQFFTGRMPFVPPNQQRQSTEGDSVGTYAGRKLRADLQVGIRYDTRCYFNVRSKADISQLNLPHGTASREQWRSTASPLRWRRLCHEEREQVD